MRPCIRCATLDGFVELAHSLGLDPAQQMARVGLVPADLAAPDKWIPAAPAAWLLEMSAADSGCEDFGLQLSERRRLATLGPLSVVLREEPDLRSALHLMIRHERSYNEAIDLQLTEANGQAAMRMWLNFGEPAPTRQGLELAVAACLGVIRELMGRDWHPRGVCFTHRAPERLTTHRQLFGPRLQFDHEFTGLLFGTDELAGRNVLADPLLRPYRPQLLHVVSPPRARTPADQVRELLQTLLPVGRCSMRQVARSLGLTTRTLRRRLDEQQENFSSILDDTRATLAERCLANDRLSLTDITHQLGFAAPSAFSRWFRHRFGMTPTEWRRVAHATRMRESMVAAARLDSHPQAPEASARPTMDERRRGRGMGGGRGPR
jgi:AraC-like DNA-binding protein